MEATRDGGLEGLYWGWFSSGFFSILHLPLTAVSALPHSWPLSSLWPPSLSGSCPGVLPWGLPPTVAAYTFISSRASEKSKGCLQTRHRSMLDIAAGDCIWLSCERVCSVWPSFCAGPPLPGPVHNGVGPPFCLQLPRSLRIAPVVHVKTCSPRSLPAGQREHCVWAMLVPSTSQFPLSIWFTGQGRARRIIPISQCWRCTSRLKFRLLMPVTLIKTGPTGGCGGTPWVWGGWC